MSSLQSASACKIDLTASEIRFRLLAEASNDVIVLTDLSGERRYVSPAMATVLGWQPEELLGHDLQADRPSR